LEVTGKILTGKGKLIKKIIQLEERLLQLINKEKDLVEKVNLLEHALDEANIHCLATDAQGTVIHVSDPFVEMLGKKKVQIIGSSIENALNGSHYSHIDFRKKEIETKEMGKGWLYILDSPQYATLHSSEMLELMPTGAVYFDRAGAILQMNGKSKSLIFNANKNNIEVNSIYQVNLFKATPILKDIDMCMLKGIPVEHKKCLVVKGNINLFYEYSIVPTRNLRQQVTGGLLLLQNNSGELIVQEELLRILTTLDNTGVAIITTDASYNLSYVNHSAVDLWQFASNGAMIKGHSIQDLFDGPSVKKLMGHWDKLVSDRVYYFSDELLAVRSNGGTFPVEVKATLVLDNNEKPEGMTFSIHDISDQYAIRDELVKAKDKAEESDRLKSAFLANMSHEIRTPMNGILGFSNLLKKKGLVDEIKDKYINLINANGEMLVKIIDDIIDLAKIESGQLKIVENECDVNLLFDEILVHLNKFAKKYNKTHISLNLNTPSENKITIQADSLRLKQVLLNLLENALKFTLEGRVEFGYITKDGQIQFFVRDTGIGIPYEKQHLIFDRFLQLDCSPAREHGGTGLGLTICKSLVEMMDGKIWVESKPDKGSEFHVMLPKSIGLSEVMPDFTVVEDDCVDVDWNGKNILIAEDEENNYFLLEEFLRDTGARLFWAKEGLECVKMFTEHSIDLVLLDIKIPNLSGYEVVGELKKINKKVPVIAQTAYALTGDKERILQAGCDDYISKPIEMSAIFAKIKKYLG
jgi:PAS domain S-box-containing protein